MLAERKNEDQARIASYAAREEAAQAEQEAAPPPPGSDDGYSDHGQQDLHDDADREDANEGEGPIPPHSPRPAPAPQSAPTETKLKLTLRGSLGEAKIQAKLTHTVAKLLAHYGKKHSLSPEAVKKLKLEDPEGDIADPSAMVQDIGVEDDDMLTVLGG
jgi:hypothetical protein